MTIKVEFRGPLESHGLQTIFLVETEKQSRVRDVLRNLLQRNKGLEELFTDLESLERNTLILLNERDVDLFNGLDTQLDNGDDLLVLPLIHGG